MERSRHSRQHRHHRNHHHRSPSLKPLPDTKRAANDSRHDRYRGHGPQGDLDHRSLVQTWLQHTEFSGQDYLEERGELAGPDRSTKTSRGYRRPVSADSSIIAAIVPHREHGSTHRTIHTPRESKLKDDRDHHKNRKRKRRIPSLQSQSADEPHLEKATYEKRARHKTREDKYEPYHGGPAHSKPVEAASGTKALRSASKEKEKTRGKRKSTGLATAKELMGKFQSDAIHHERLTMLPSMHVGIFNNSKHGKAPGDLAFGEMSFLKEPRPGETTKSAPKTRSLESRKRDQKELENIEVFFSHKKHEDNESRKTKQVRHGGTPIGGLGLTDNVSRPTGGSSRVSPSSRATTYLSCSSSNHPQRVTKRQAGVREQREETALEQTLERRTSCSHPSSMTPDPIRQKLIETGIYRCLPRSEPQWPSTKDPSSPELDEKNKEDSEPPYRSEGTRPPKAPFSRAHIAQQAYIKPRDRAPLIPLREQIVASTELPTLPKPSLAKPLPVRERPPETYDLPLSDHGVIPESKSLSPILEDGSATDPTPYVQQQLPGSAMMHSPDDVSILRRTPQLPIGHSNSRYGMGAFRSISSISSRLPLDAGRWQMGTNSGDRSPYWLSTDRASTLHSASPYGGSILQERGNAYSATIRRQSMRDYIADLEEKTFNVGDSDRGGVEYRPLQPEVQVMQTEQMHVAMLSPTGQSFEQMTWEQEPAAHSAYEANTPLPPANPYSIPGYEPVEYGQNEQIRVHHMAGPPRPGTAMSGNKMDMALYWKPNTYGL